MESFVYVAVYNNNGLFHFDMENSSEIAANVVITDTANFCYLIKLVVIK